MIQAKIPLQEKLINISSLRITNLTGQTENKYKISYQLLLVGVYVKLKVKSQIDRISLDNLK